MSDTTMDRIRPLMELVRPKRDKFNYAINGMLLQHLAHVAATGIHRDDPRYADTAPNLRRFAMEEFSQAGRHGFIDC